MHDNLAKSLGFIFAWEGGMAVRANEPGGAVNMGVSMQTFAAWRALHGEPVPSIGDLETMSRDEATAIYAVRYAAPVHFDELPSGLDLAVLDCAINEGVGGALGFLNAALGFPAAHTLDARGLWAAKHHEVARTIDRICDARLAAKRQRPEWARFGPGWTNRIESIRRSAQAMVAGRE